MSVTGGHVLEGAAAAAAGDGGGECRRRRRYLQRTRLQRPAGLGTSAIAPEQVGGGPERLQRRQRRVRRQLRRRECGLTAGGGGGEGEFMVETKKKRKLCFLFELCSENYVTAGTPLSACLCKKRQRKNPDTSSLHLAEKSVKANTAT